MQFLEKNKQKKKNIFWVLDPLDKLLWTGGKRTSELNVASMNWCACMQPKAMVHASFPVMQFWQRSQASPLTGGAPSNAASHCPLSPAYTKSSNRRWNMSHIPCQISAGSAVKWLMKVLWGSDKALWRCLAPVEGITQWDGAAKAPCPWLSS